MSRVFENPEGVRVMEKLREVYGRPRARRCEEIEPVFMVRVTLSNGEELGWTSRYLCSMWDIKTGFKWRAVLNKEVSKAYLINLTTGEARCKEVVRQVKEMGKGVVGRLTIEKMVGGERGQNTEKVFEDGEKMVVEKLEIIDRDEMPIEEVLETMVGPSLHPKALCKYDEHHFAMDKDIEFFVRDLKKHTERLREDISEGELGVVLCNIVDEIFRVHNKTGIRFDKVWDDYVHSVITGSMLRTEEIIEYYKNSEKNKENSSEE